MPDESVRIAHVSDLHILAAPPAQGIVRPDATARARALMADLSAFRPALDLVVITGDLANDARPEEYAMLAEVLAGLEVPHLLLPGNHDDRALLRATQGSQGWEEGPWLYRRWRKGGVRVLALDSLSPGEIGGRLAPGQLDRLAADLAEPFAGATVIALHHPPVAPRMGQLDGAILLEGGERLRALAAALPRPVTLLCGHMHRPFVAPWAGGIVSAATSTAFQFRLELDAPVEPPAEPEPYHYSVHVFDGAGGQVIHRRFPPALAT